MTDKTTLLLLNHINSEKRDSLNGHSPYEAVSYTHLDVYKRQRFTSAQIPVTGQRDTATVKAGIKVFPVSYTHLDVYKRQCGYCPQDILFNLFIIWQNIHYRHTAK